jgi:MFS family permease
VATPVASILDQALATSPLRHASFRGFYMASVGVALGYTMQATMAAWLMATMTTSELMVALVQTASTAPAILFGLVAGALSDIVERKKVVYATQGIFIAGTLILGVLTVMKFMVPWALLFFTFVIGIAFTFYMPAQQASINELVERPDVPKAVALGAVAMNVSRAIGPALAGLLAAVIMEGWALILTSVFFVGMIFVVRGWVRQPQALPGVPESLLTGIGSGLRFTRHSAPMRAILLRNLTFAFCASSLYALLPVIARDTLQMGAGGFGVLFGCFGAGAVVAALNIPRALQKHSLQRMVVAASLLWIISATLIAATDATALALIGSFGAGASWVGVFASLSAGTQSIAPAWVRARAVAMTFVTVQVAIAVGSVLWGLLASWKGSDMALITAATTFLLLLALHRGVRVRLGVDKDILPSDQSVDFHLAAEPEPDDGPVLIQIEYRIVPENRDAFLRAVRAIGPVRRRNGANSWRVFRDLAEENLYVERYIISSWAEYVRLRSRMTIADRQIQEEVARHQREGVEIRVSRFLGVDLPEGLRPVHAAKR